MFLPQFCIRNSVRVAYAIITENYKVTWTIVICRAYRDDMLICKTQRASSHSQLFTRTRYSGNNLHSNRQLVKNKYFGLKKTRGLPPHLELLAVLSHKSGHDMSEQCNHICLYRKYDLHSFTHAWACRHRQTV